MKKPLMIILGSILLIIGVGVFALNVWDGIYGFYGNAIESVDRARERRATAILEAQKAKGTEREAHWLEKAREADRDVSSLLDSRDYRKTYNNAGIAIGLAFMVIGLILFVFGLRIRT